MHCEVGSKVEERGFLVSMAHEADAGLNVLLLQLFLKSNHLSLFFSYHRRCLKMLVGLELGTDDGASCQDTASPTGLTQTTKRER